MRLLVFSLLGGLRSAVGAGRAGATQRRPVDWPALRDTLLEKKVIDAKTLKEMLAAK